jgi:protease II
VLHVLDLATGRELTPPIDRIRYAGVNWLDDGSGFFYARLREGYDKLPPAERFGDHTTHFHALTGGGDRAVFSASRNPELQLPSFAAASVFQVPGTQTAAALVYMGVDRNLQLLVADLAAARVGGPVWRRVVGSADQVTAVAVGHGWFYLKTSLGAPRYKLMRMPVANPALERAQVLVPESQGAIGDIAAARDGLYLTRRDGVNTTLLRVPQGEPVRLDPIALPFAGSVEIKSTSLDRNGAVFEMIGWTRAPKDYVYEPANGRVALLPLARDGAFDAPTDIEAREVLVKSHDGTMVPLSIVARKGVKLDGSHPTVLYGYGAYGVTDDPFFSPRVYAWIQRGGVWATAHVRGGGVYGKDWHDAGRKTTKPNTWKDAIAAGEWLVVAHGDLRRQRRRHLCRASHHRAAGFVRCRRTRRGRDGHGAHGVERQWRGQHSRVRHRKEGRRVQGAVGDEQLPPGARRHTLPGGDGRAWRQRHPCRCLAFGQVRLALEPGHDERQAGADAPGIRLGPRPGQHAHAGAGTFGRSLQLPALAVRDARVPTALKRFAGQAFM